MTSSAAPKASRALDDLIMGTNSSSIVSKRSVERLYYPDEPHYFRYFVRKFQRRAPLINRGYWLRLRAIDVIVREFLTRASNKKKVVINLGCGSDVLPWQCHARYPSACNDVLFVDVDYPDLMKKKALVVQETPHLREVLGTDRISIDMTCNNGVVLRSDKYCQIGCDLRRLDTLRKSLETLFDPSESHLLFVAEVSITYMDTPSADALIQWASSIGQSEFCLLEQILPQGASHPFAQTMLAHFDKLKTPPQSVRSYPDVNSQAERFSQRGWKHVEIWDLWDAWCSDRFLNSSERMAFDEVEPFDEWEEFMLFARHYFVLHATSMRPDGPSLKQGSSAPLPENRGCELQVREICRHKSRSLERRFGSALMTENPLGQRFLLHMMGMGSNGRADTYDIHALGHKGPAPKLPLTGPAPRMCHTVTDLGEYGILLAGGRGSPASAMSDCWIFHKGTNCHWNPTWSLPTPLYRHSTIRLRGSSLALLLGGKSDSVRISQDCFVLHLERGWLRCAISGEKPEPLFGAVLCNLPQSKRDSSDFHGLLAGGIGKDGNIGIGTYTWSLDMADVEHPVISFRKTAEHDRALAVFGAQTVELGRITLVCGGTGQSENALGQTITVVSGSEHGHRTTSWALPRNQERSAPFLIGSSAVSDDGKLIVLGGGATCFSMGTYWETGLYEITVPAEIDDHAAPEVLDKSISSMTFVESVKIVQSPRDGKEIDGSSRRATVTDVPRITLDDERTFEDMLRDRRPVIIQDLQLGDCLQRWTPERMVERVGPETSVVVHECERDTEKMDFNSKNFRYTTDSFGTVMAKMQNGGRMYLRSLSREKPSESPANLEQDFPSLAEEFRLPEELRYVSDNLFSSVLRISGKVNMWLHYDVMANVYAQIQGTKRMIIFPPGDVTHLSFAPGASSSSLDVFSALETSLLAGTHPYEAALSPGDVLLLPPMWLHTARPTTDMSVAVNVFFRDLAAGYAAGRDVYGNRDLAAYDKGRQEAARIARGFEGLPGDVRRFYLARIAQEMMRDAEGS